MNIAMICETPFQLLNEISLRLNHYNEEYIHCDLFISTQNKGMDFYTERIKKTDIFDHVFPYCFEKKTGNKYKYKFQRFKEYFFPYLVLKDIFRSYTYKHDYQYDVIVTGMPNPVIVDFCHVYSHADVWFIDEGMGSYCKKIGNLIGTRKSRIIEKLLNRGSHRICPKKYYLYSPKLSKCEYENVVIEKLQSVNNSTQDVKETINEIFDIKLDDKYKDNKIIYFTQYFNKEFVEAEKNICMYLNSHLRNILFRIHPSQDSKEYCNIHIDMDMYQWELLCGELVDDENILIAAFSTAQFTPKLMYGTEPIIILLYELYSEYLDTDLLENARNIVKSFIEFYDKKEKIYIPQNFEEFALILNRLSPSS